MRSSCHYHFIGVAGVGMSALAQAVQSQGHLVTGSDRYFDSGREMEVIDKLCGMGIRFVPQDGTGITATTRGVVYSSAIEDDNPDILAAKRLGAPLLHRAAMLARLTRGKRCIAVTGTSGKSTVTGMIGWTMDQLGFDPTVVNGAPVLNWVSAERIGNARLGRSDWWVIEADESDKSLLRFRPDWAVITNASKDHFELDIVERLFHRFSRQVRRGLISTLDSPDLLRDLKIRRTAHGTRFVYRDVPFDVPLIGDFNAHNAFLAVLLCERLGCDLVAVRKALRSFKGIHRRLETAGAARGITVIDDYAHNPAKIRAAWGAVAPYAKRVLAIWRPHGFGPLRLMMEELAAAFGEVRRPQDRLLVLPVFDAGGTANRSVRSEMLVARLTQSDIGACEAVSGYDDALRRIRAIARPGDVILSMGARDPGLPELARRIVAAVSRK
jgi:UDP-N-acetylmuramate--alanine ligase